MSDVEDLDEDPFARDILGHVKSENTFVNSDSEAIRHLFADATGVENLIDDATPLNDDAKDCLESVAIREDIKSESEAIQHMYRELYFSDDSDSSEPDSDDGDSSEEDDFDRTPGGKIDLRDHTDSSDEEDSTDDEFERTERGKLDLRKRTK
jgi:hypothetical protein